MSQRSTMSKNTKKAPEPGPFKEDVWWWLLG